MSKQRIKTEYKINVEFIVDKEFYNDYEDILTSFENDLSSIGVMDITTSEEELHNNTFALKKKRINNYDKDK